MAKKAKVYTGTEWVDLAAATTDLSQYPNMTTTPISGFRNAIINGDFRINQRGFTSTTSGGYGVDRWYTQHGSGTVTASSPAFTPGTGPSGYESANHFRMVTTGQTVAGSFALLSQKVEDVRTFAGQTITVSFWAKAASGTPNLSIEFEQNFGTGGSPSSAINAIGVRKISLAGGTSWTRYTTTTTIPSISGKTLGTTANTSSLTLNFWLSAGTDFNSRTDLLGIQSNTFDIWGVQVESGSIATPFEQRPIGIEITLCQRYYEKSYDIHVAPGTITDDGLITQSGSAAGRTTGEIRSDVSFKVTKRVKPVVVVYDSVGNINKVTRGDYGTSFNSNQTVGVPYIGQSNFCMFSGGAGVFGSAHVLHYTANAEF